MPPRQQQVQPQYLDEHHQRIAEFANDYLDDDDERDAFMTEFMGRRGYTARTRTDWEPPQEEERPNGSRTQGGGQRQKPSYFKH